MLVWGDAATNQGRRWWMGARLCWSGKLISVAGSRLWGGCEPGQQMGSVKEEQTGSGGGHLASAGSGRQ